MNREEFLEWLNGCKCNYVYEKDDYGLINITFYPAETEENEDDNNQRNDEKLCG